MQAYHGNDGGMHVSRSICPQIGPPTPADMSHETYGFLSPKSMWAMLHCRSQQLVPVLTTLFNRNEQRPARQLVAQYSKLNPHWAIQSFLAIQLRKEGKRRI